ncbi:hypothetical protein LIER_25117 [Lithospermum erythrorhizon]|uniref:Gag-pol polyprotein n=1 Tax=Lithospermum erythrorhizon TaxID=34254 RepID=A0AAV3R507_LITER
MDDMKEGGSITRPPVLDGTKEEYSDDEEELAHANTKALNSIFCGIDANMFKMINQCTCAKEAWEILKVENEGTDKLRMSKIQQLTTKFEALSMKEDESISGLRSDKDEVGELIGSLITHGMKIGGRTESKKQNIALKSQIEDSKEVSGENMALMVRNINRVFGELNKRLYEEKRLNSKGRKRVIGGTATTNGMQKPFKRIQFHECEDYRYK